MTVVPKLKQLIAENPAAEPVTFAYARIYPDVPNRFAAIVDWLDRNLRTAGYAFMVERLGARAAEIESDWVQVHGLTPAEIRLAAHLVRGGTVSGYAKEHGLSRNTVRNQLQSAYCKTGTHRQAELVALLLKP